MTTLLWEFPKVIDSTMRAAFVSCEQKFSYEFGEGLRAGSGTSVHLHAGACFAKGLEVLRNTFFGEGRDIEAALSAAYCAVLVEWGDFQPMFSWDTGAGTKTLDSVLAALDFYVQTWPPSLDVFKPHRFESGKLAVEFTFALPIPGVVHPATGEPILYVGRFDQLGVYDGVMYCGDDKTASQLGPSWFEQWDLRGQFTGYSAACRDYGYPVGGVIVRGISFLKNGFGSAEHVSRRDDWQLDRWWTQLARDVERMKAMWASGIPNQALSDPCNAFGGCPYRKLCLSREPTRWKGEYTVQHWNPLQTKV